MYSLGEYYDQDTGRTRYAAFSEKTHTWQFARHYGKAAALRLVDRLNKTLSLPPMGLR